MKLLKLNSGNSARQNFPSHDQARICHGENEDGQNVKVFSGWSACTEYLMEKLKSFQMPSLCVFVLLLNVSCCLSNYGRRTRTCKWRKLLIESNLYILLLFNMPAAIIVYLCLAIERARKVFVQFVGFTQRQHSTQSISCHPHNLCYSSRFVSAHITIFISYIIPLSLDLENNTQII